MCSNSPVLNGMLPFSGGSSHPPVYPINLLFRDNTAFNIGYLWIFQVYHPFDVKILATSNEIRCVRCSRPLSSSWAVDPCQQKHQLFWHERKKRRERVWELIVCNFVKSPVKLNRLLLKFVCYVKWIFTKLLAKRMQNSAFQG